MAQIISLIIGYFAGALIQTSYWYGRRQNVDIRNYGSGNAGTTNAMRTLGKKAGIITAVGDILKVFLSALICWLIFRGTGMPAALIFLYSGLGTVVGHNFPFYMKFKGGKGIATTAGVIISLFFQPNALWVMTLIGVITFFGVLILTRYVSVASLALVTEFLIEFIIWSGSGNTALRGREIAQGICLVIIIVALCYLRHIGNIERLLDGNERRFGEKKANVRRERISVKRQSEEEKEKIYETEDIEEIKETEENYRPEDEETYGDTGLDDDDIFGDFGLHDADNINNNDTSDSYDNYDNYDSYISPVKEIKDDELPKEAPPKRKFIWDAEKQCYVRYKDTDS